MDSTIFSYSCAGWCYA